ncbi:hypothetical protein AB0F81_31685 [Actinoplanes sp. NPDC024001]|uniref:hypothetical protein n=1 Tax=Actinoplanes sp. NPDC024001 TaxID=3154598 RepID=UPI0033E01591
MNYWWRWPFPDDGAFWAWAMDPYAELDSQDEDLLLTSPFGWRLLIAAADRADCPKSAYCCRIVENGAVQASRVDDEQVLDLLRAARAQAAGGTQPHTLRLGEYIERLFGYRAARGPVKRARAEQMAADLLAGPSAQAQMAELGHSGWLQTRVTAKGRHWMSVRAGGEGPYLYVNRRSGAWRLSRRPLTDAEESAL